MRCLHCASGLGPTYSRGEELSTAEATKLCHELKDLGCEYVVLSGGEALLRDDWEDIAQELASLGVAASLITNGLLMTCAMAKRIKDAGVCRVALSLDGLEATHNYIRHHPQSFAVVRLACSLLRDAGMRVNIVTHINRMNLSELEAMEALVSGLGVDVWRLQLGAPVGRMAEHPELHLVPEQLPEIADFIVAAKQRGAVYIDVGDNIGYFSEHERELRSGADTPLFGCWCGCSAGCLAIGIEANGNVKGCLSLQSSAFVEGNVRDDSLSTIWNRPGGFRYTRGFTTGDLTGYCEGCEFGEICRGGCTFMAFGATGSPHNNPFCLYHVQSRR
jgi:radical SAM protein with 4Fe4S-binding SPASM domain